MVKRKFACAALLLWGAFGAPAAAETYTVYKCVYDVKGGLPEYVLFATDAAGKTFTYHLPDGADKPVRVPVKVRPAGADTSIFLFSISQRNSETGMVLLTVQARVPKAGGDSRLKVQARRFRDVPSSSGTCELERGVTLPY